MLSPALQMACRLPLCIYPYLAVASLLTVTAPAVVSATYQGGITCSGYGTFSRSGVGSTSWPSGR